MPGPAALPEIPATPAQVRTAIGAMAVSVAVFVALAPFAQVKLTPVPAFISAYQSALVLLDVVTAALLLGQYRVTRSAPLLWLACGYVFTAVMALAHTLTFPGLFGPQGVLGGGRQTTAWIYMFWHAVFPLFVAGYAVGKPAMRLRGAGRRWLVGTSMLALALVLLATAGEGLLPRIMEANSYAPPYRVVVGLVWLCSALAFALLWRKQSRTLLDVWLMTAMCVWVCEVGLAAVFNAGRFDLGFYAGRTFGLLAAGFLLVALLVQYSEVYGREATLREQAFRRTEERYQKLFTSIDEGFCIIELAFDAEGRPVDYIFHEVNPSFEQQTGLVDVVGKSIRSLAPAHESHWFDTYARVLQTGQPIRFQNEARALNRWYDVYAFCVDEEQRVAVLFTDITARVQAEQSLREADRRKNEFLAMLGHELRNPLAPIRSAAEVLALTNEPAKVERAAAVIRRQVAHLAALVDDLLDVARVTRGSIHLDRRPLQMADVVREALEQAQPLLDQRAHQVQVSGIDGDVAVFGDRQRLVQVVVNMLNNAARYTEPGGRIALHVRSQSGWVEILMTDNGRGMPADLVPRVFDLFTQGEHAIDRPEGGLDIGLSVVRTLVERHGGTVHAHSEGAGRGSTFTVRLPALQPPAAVADEPVQVSTGQIGNDIVRQV